MKEGIEYLIVTTSLEFICAITTAVRDSQQLIRHSLLLLMKIALPLIYHSQIVSIAISPSPILLMH